MQNIASIPADQFEELLRRLPADLDLDSLARETKAIERKREIASGATLLRLSLARGPGGLSLSQAAAWATMLAGVRISDPGVKYRLDKSVEFLEAVMMRQLAAKAPGAAVRWPGRMLRGCDGSCIRQRGSTSADWRVHAVYDLGRGGFSHLELTDKHGAGAIDRGAAIPGEIRIGDRNFGRAASLQRFRQQSAGQADFIVRVGWNAFNLRRPDGPDFDLIGHLGTLPGETLAHEVMVQAKVGPLAPPGVAPDHPAQDRGSNRDDTQEAAGRGVAQAEDAGSAQPDCGRIHDRGDLIAGRGVSVGRGARGVPLALASLPLRRRG